MVGGRIFEHKTEGPFLDLLHFIYALTAREIPNKGTIIEIWHNEAIINSLPARHVDKAGKTLQSTNLSACLCTNIIYVFIKLEIFVNTDARGSDRFRKFDFLTLHWHTKFACLFVAFQQQTQKFSRVCFHSIIKEPLNRDFSFSLQLQYVLRSFTFYCISIVYAEFFVFTLFWLCFVRNDNNKDDQSIQW